MMRFNRVNKLDTQLFLWFGQFTNHRNVRWIKYISKSGDGHLYLLLSVALFWSDTQHGVLFFYVALMAYSLEIPIYLIMKQLFKRPRPAMTLDNFKSLITPSDKFSLPSGHTAAAFLMATIITYFYPIFAPVTFVWASLVGCSRVLLGVHYPSDILMGAALGVSIACTSLLVLG